MSRLLAAAMLLCAGGAHALTQADLDEPLTNFVTSDKGDFVAVCRALHTGCGIEMIDGVESLAATSSPLPRAGRTAREILDEYVANRPHDDWALVDGVLNLKPAMRPSPDWLSKKSAMEHVVQADAYQLSMWLLQGTGAAVGHRQYQTAPLLKPAKPLPKGLTVRQSLNALAKADGEYVWIVEHAKTGGRYKLVFRALSFREAKPGILNANPEASRVTERLVR